MRKSCKRVFAVRVNFVYCILHITICDIIQTCHTFFLVLQSSLAILLNYYRMTQFEISLEKVKHKKKRKFFDAKITII